MRVALTEFRIIEGLKRGETRILSRFYRDYWPAQKVSTLQNYSSSEAKEIYQKSIIYVFLSYKNNTIQEEITTLETYLTETILKNTSNNTPLDEEGNLWSQYLNTIPLEKEPTPIKQIYSSKKEETKQHFVREESFWEKLKKRFL